MPTIASLQRRPLLNTFCASLLMALCAACGGGGGAANPGSPAAVTPPPVAVTPPPVSVTPPPVVTPPVITPALSILAGKPDERGNLDGSGVDARLAGPMPLAIDAAGNLYGGQPCAIRKITPAGMVSTRATTVTGCNGGPATEPNSLAMTAAADGTLFYTTWGGNIIEVSPAGVVRTAAKLEDGYVEFTGGWRPYPGVGIAVDGAGNLIVANDIGTRKISPSGVTTMLEGVASASAGFNTYIPRPRGVAVDAAGTVYLAARDNTILRIDAAGTTTVLAGAPSQFGNSDGAGAAARFTHVSALALDSKGNLYAVDSYASYGQGEAPLNELIRKITPAGVVTTIAGTPGVNVLKTGALPGSLAPLGGIALDGKGNLYASSGNAIVKIDLP